MEYTHLWVDKEASLPLPLPLPLTLTRTEIAKGETHIAECQVSKLESKGYSGTPQLVREGTTLKLTLRFYPIPNLNPP